MLIHLIHVLNIENHGCTDWDQAADVAPFAAALVRFGECMAVNQAITMVVSTSRDCLELGQVLHVELPQTPLKHEHHQGPKCGRLCGQPDQQQRLRHVIMLSLELHHGLGSSVGGHKSSRA